MWEKFESNKCPCVQLGRVYYIICITILSCKYLVETNKRDKGYIFLLGVQKHVICTPKTARKGQVELRCL